MLDVPGEGLKESIDIFGSVWLGGTMDNTLLTWTWSGKVSVIIRNGVSIPDKCMGYAVQ